MENPTKGMKSQHALMIGIVTGLVVGIGGTLAVQHFTSSSTTTTKTSGYKHMKKM